MPAKVIHAPRRSRKLLFAAQLLMASTALLLMASSTLSAQTSPSTEGAPAASSPSAAAPPLSFDVVSIHQNKSGSRQMALQSSAHSDGITMRNVSPFVMILYAYNGEIKTENLLTAPDWTKNVRYDVIAKVAPSEVPAYQKLTGEQRAAMFQKVLAERFKLRAHRETSDLPIYALVVAKGGPKLKEAKPSESYPKDAKPGGHGFAHGGRIFEGGPGQYIGEGASMADLALALSNLGPRFLGGRMVVDRTGLTGKYDFTLQMMPEEVATGAAAADEQQLASTIITAVQQLGLKLQPSTAPVEQLVVDHIERPSEN